MAWTKVFIVLCAYVCLVTAQSNASTHRSVVVTKISDGDTIKVKSVEVFLASMMAPVDVTPKAETIRLLSMDTAETHLPTKEGMVGQEFFGDKGTEALSSFIRVGQSVVLESYGEDVHNRTLARILVGDRDVNREVVETGWAIPYIICDGQTCNNERYFEETEIASYFAACERARSAGKGFFDPARPLTEMPFEFRLHKQGRKPDKYVGSFSTKTLVRPADYNQIDVCDRVFFPNPTVAHDLGYGS